MTDGSYSRLTTVIMTSTFPEGGTTGETLAAIVAELGAPEDGGYHALSSSARNSSRQRFRRTFPLVVRGRPPGRSNTTRSTRIW
jgi:hypothetical protein